MLVLFAMACSSYNLQAPDVADTASPPTLVDTDDTGTPPMLEGDWIAVTGDLEIRDGSPVVGATLPIEVWVTDSLGELMRVDCAPILEDPLAVAAPEDDVALYGFWEFTVVPDTCSLPETLALGIGPLLPTLWPVADAEEVSRKHTRGLYTGTPGSSGLTVFGVAGTIDQLNGTGTPASLEPLPDGRYFLRTAYLLPVSQGGLL